MPAFAKTNGDGVTHNELYVTNELYPVLIDVGANLAPFSGNISGSNMLLAVVNELRPVMYQSTGNSGVIHAVLDSRSGTADEIQTRIRNIGNIAGYDVTGATVTTVGNISFAS